MIELRIQRQLSLKLPLLLSVGVLCGAGATRDCAMPLPAALAASPSAVTSPLPPDPPTIGVAATAPLVRQGGSVCGTSPIASAGQTLEGLPVDALHGLSTMDLLRAPLIPPVRPEFQ
jgi:hypothetical protein